MNTSLSTLRLKARLHTILLVLIVITLVLVTFALMVNKADAQAPDPYECEVHNTHYTGSHSSRVSIRPVTPCYYILATCTHYEGQPFKLHIEVSYVDYTVAQVVPLFYYFPYFDAILWHYVPWTP